MSSSGMTPIGNHRSNDFQVETAFVREPGEGVTDATEVVDRAASARSNLKSIVHGDGDLFGGLKGIFTPDRAIRGFKANGIGGLLDGAFRDLFLDPVLGTIGIAIDAVHAAKHGILAGFQDRSKLVGEAEQTRDVMAQLGPLTEQVKGLPASAPGAGPVGGPDEAAMRVAELLTGRTPQGANDHPFDFNVTRVGGNYQVTVGMTSPDGSKLDLGAYQLDAAKGDMTRIAPPKFPLVFLKQAASDITDELERRLALPGAPDTGKNGLLVTPNGGSLDRHPASSEGGKQVDSGIYVDLLDVVEVLDRDEYKRRDLALKDRLDPFLRDMIATTPSLQKYACLDIRYHQLNDDDF